MRLTFCLEKAIHRGNDEILFCVINPFNEDVSAFFEVVRFESVCIDYIDFFFSLSITDC